MIGLQGGGGSRLVLEYLFEPAARTEKVLVESNVEKKSENEID